MKRTTFALLLFAHSGFAQERPEVNGPVLGYAVHAGSLRALYGIPGAVSWGPAIGPGLEAAAVSPKHDAAIACAGGQVFLIPVARPDERVRLLDAICTRIVFSDRGGAAVIHDQSARRLVVVTGLTSAPNTAWEIEAIGALSALAVTDDGAKLLVAGEDAAFQVSADGARFVLPGVGAVSSISITGQTAWISARDEPVALEIDLASGAPAVRKSATLASAAALAVSRDGAILAAIDRETKQPWLWHLSRGEAIAMEGACQGDSLQVLDGNAVFQLVGRDGKSCIIDADRETPRIFLLPGAPQ
jgi:hypothetical protein